MGLIESPLDFSRVADGLQLDLVLPFSWKVLYFSAVSFTVAFLIYLWRYPPLLRAYLDYDEYHRDGGNAERMKSYVIAQKYPETALGDEPGAITNYPANQTEVTSSIDPTTSYFLSVREFENPLDYPSRTICAGFYAAGFLGLVYVTLENFAYVVFQTN